MAAGKKTDPKKLDAFLDELAAGNATKHACEAADIGRTTVYELRAADSDFAARWKAAEDEGVEVLEQEARRRAVDGVERPVTIAGERELVREYSDTLLIFLLKAKRPGIYREHFKHEHSGPDGGPIELAVAGARDKLAARLDSGAPAK